MVGGRTRRIAIDALGMAVVIRGASVQDSDPSPHSADLAPACIRVRLTWPDAGYADELVA